MKKTVKQGDRFGRLKIINEVDSMQRRRDGRRAFLCRCDCGQEKIISVKLLFNGQTKSCGCLKIELTAERRKTHGMSRTRLHRIWCQMLQRCRNINDSSYSNYGGRGITVCKEWQDDFVVFHTWAMSNGYKDNLSIDRIDGNGNYEPSNCRWASKSYQTQNTRCHKGKVSKYKGVTWKKARNRWLATVWRNGNAIHCGSFNDEELAALAYDKKALEVFGKFARLNFPNKETA